MKEKIIKLKIKQIATTDYHPPQLIFPCLSFLKRKSIFQQTVNNEVSSLMRLTFYDNLYSCVLSDQAFE